MSNESVTESSYETQKNERKEAIRLTIDELKQLFDEKKDLLNLHDLELIEKRSKEFVKDLQERVAQD